LLPDRTLPIFDRGLSEPIHSEVLAPEVEDELASALEAIAIVHGGEVVESSAIATRNYQRQFVNIFDCESSLEGEVEWLRNRFPYSRFTLKEYM